MMPNASVTGTEGEPSGWVSPEHPVRYAKSTHLLGKVGGNGGKWVGNGVNGGCRGARQEKGGGGGGVEDVKRAQ